jgi:hypothetical protein
MDIDSKKVEPANVCAPLAGSNPNHYKMEVKRD